MSTLQLGDSGRDVEVWQRFLAQVWLVEFDTMMPGTFDEATEDATRVFQEEHKLNVTGIVDRDTFAAARLQGHAMIDAMIYKGPTKTTALMVFAILVVVSFMSQCMLMPDSGRRINGQSLPLSPTLNPTAPRPPSCPGWFC